MKNTITVLFLLIASFAFGQTTIDPVTKDTTVKETTIIVTPKTGVYTYNETATITTITVKKYVKKDTVVTPPVIPSERKNLIQESLFDTDNLSIAIKGWSDEQRDKSKPYSLKVIDGKLVFELHKGDAEVSSSVRTEITKQIPTEIWFGGTLNLQDFAEDTDGESFFQVHTELSTPPLALRMYGNDITILSARTNSSYRDYPVGTLKEWNNKNIDVVIHAKFATGNTGIVECWINGEKKLNLPNVATTASLNLNAKLGMNKWGWFRKSTNTTVRKFSWDKVRIGNEKATYNDVKP